MGGSGENGEGRGWGGLRRDHWGRRGVSDLQIRTEAAQGGGRQDTRAGDRSAEWCPRHQRIPRCRRHERRGCSRSRCSPPKR